MKVAETESMIDGTKLAESMFGNITLTMMVFLVIGKEAKLSTIHVRNIGVHMQHAVSIFYMPMNL